MWKFTKIRSNIIENLEYIKTTIRDFCKPIISSDTYLRGGGKAQRQVTPIELEGGCPHLAQVPARGNGFTVLVQSQLYGLEADNVDHFCSEWVLQNV